MQVFGGRQQNLLEFREWEHLPFIVVALDREVVDVREDLQRKAEQLWCVEQLVAHLKVHQSVGAATKKVANEIQCRRTWRTSRQSELAPS